jgi:hypothetical protein
MSTKSTRRYVNTKDFYFHLYDDFARSGGISIRVGNAETFIPLSQEEIDDIDAQLNGEESKLTYQEDEQ